MAIVALVIGHLIVWMSGALIVTACLQRSTRDGALPLALGTGWLVGAFLLTLHMRLLSLLSVPFSVLSIGTPFALVTCLLAYRCRAALRVRTGAFAALTGQQLPSLQRIAWCLLLSWLTVRYALLLAEIVWRPLYPWDAWTQWGTKGRVYFELRRLAPFVSGTEWLSGSVPGGYYDAAPHYPATVPLLQTWAATLLGEWIDTWINLPWWITGIALALVVYGFLAQEGFGPLFALVGTWLVISLPILDVHVALAGYADLPMATYLTAAGLLSCRAVRKRAPGEIFIAATLLCACALIKNPGKIWVLALLPGLLAARWPQAGRTIAATSVVAAVGLVLVLSQTKPVIIGYHLHLDFDMPWSALLQAYFTLGNWHLLWYACIAVALLARRHLFSPAVAPYTCFVTGGVLFLMFGFAFTNARVWVEDQSTVNRATLHLAPLAVVWMLFVFKSWVAEQSEWQRSHAATAAESRAG